MVGDFGREDANGNPVATFYVIDPADGRRLAELPLSGQWELRIEVEHRRGRYRLAERVQVP